MWQYKQIYLLRHSEINCPSTGSLIGQQELSLTSEVFSRWKGLPAFLPHKKKLTSYDKPSVTLKT